MAAPVSKGKVWGRGIVWTRFKKMHVQHVQHGHWAMDGDDIRRDGEARRQTKEGGAVCRETHLL